MSKTNPNQDYFKTRGREPIGQGVEHDIERREFTKERAEIDKKSVTPAPIPGTRGKHASDEEDKDQPKE